MSPRRHGIVDALAGYRSVCEVGIGRRPGAARALSERGVRVTATDVHDRPTPEGVRFVRDDAVAASERADPGECYRAAAVYALDCPPDLHGALLELARRVGADCPFTTLGGDPPAVDARPVALEGGETLYVARERRRTEE